MLNGNIKNYINPYIYESGRIDIIEKLDVDKT